MLSKNTKIRGFAFSIDAVLALMLVIGIISAVFLYFNQSTSYLSSSRPVLQGVSQEGVSLLSHLKISDIRREPIIISYYDAGYLTSSHLNLSVLEVIGEFWASGNYTQASDLADAIIPKFVPSSLNWAIEYDGNIVASSAALPSTTSLSSSKRFVSGLNNSAPSTGCIARSFVERIRGKQEVSTNYFGGFLGQGNFSVTINDVPAGSNVTSFLIQANSPANFSFSVNGFECANLTTNGGNLNVTTWNITSSTCISEFVAGSSNQFAFTFSRSNVSDSYFDGGFLQVYYQTDNLVYTPTGRVTFQLPQIDGLVNYFSSFYVPGNVTNVSAYIQFFNNYTTYMNIGNKTIFNTTGSPDVQIVTVSNASFATFFPNLMSLSSQTIPFKITAVANATGQTGNADIVLITDLSGSMAWRMDSDSAGNTVTNCSSASINSASTNRISVAKCVDSNFVDAIFQGPGNRIALVSFSTNIVNYTSLTNNSAYLKSVISAYSTNGGTCISCAINKAHDLLASESSSDRKKYVIVMTDGVANYRATNFCPNSSPFNEIDAINSTAGIIAGRADASLFDIRDTYFDDVGLDQSASYDFYAIDYDTSTRAFMSGDNGQIWELNGASWSRTLNAGSNALYGISVMVSLNKGFAVGESGKIYKWNGATWSADIDAGSNVFYDVDMYNATFAFAVGSSGKIYKLIGTTWSQDVDLGSQTLYDVKIISPTLAYASGVQTGSPDQSIVYKWNGATWSSSTSVNSRYFYAMDAYNSTLTFLGGANGYIYSYDGTSLTAMTTPTTSQVNGITFVNNTYALAATSAGTIWYWQGGNTWYLSPIAFNVYKGNNTVGIDCGDSSSCGSSATGSTLNANYSSCRIFQEIANSTINSVGFGPVSTCSLGLTTLQNVATCGNGSYFGSSNASALQDFYRSIALSIITQQNASQIKNITGSVNTSLFNSSYISFEYTPEVTGSTYQQISLPFETDYFNGCTGSVFIPSEMTVDEFTVTSYTSDKWTSNVTIKNSANNWTEIYNLSTFNSTYVDLGDAFMIKIPPRYIKSGEWNNISIKSGYSAGNASSFCSNYNKAIYRGRVTAAVNYSAIFLSCTSKTVRVYYDLDHNSVSDGYVDVLIGSGLPSGAVGTINPNQLNVTTDAVDDAFMRLLDTLNSVQVNASDVSGMITNPIDIKLDSQIGTEAVTNKGIPFLWGPVEATLITWPKGVQ